MDEIILALNVLGVLGNVGLYLAQQRQRWRREQRELEMLRAVCFVAAVVESPHLFSPQLRHMAREVLPAWARTRPIPSSPSQAVH